MCNFQCLHSWLCYLQKRQAIHPWSAGRRKIVLHSQPPPEFHTLSNKLLSKTIYFITFFSPMLSTGYRSFWSTSKQCWQGHNWTFFSAQHQYYLEGLLSFSALLFLASGYNILPFSMGATLLACQVLPHSCCCLHSPKLFLEDHLLTAPQTNPFQVAVPTHSQQKALSPSSMQ